MKNNIIKSTLLLSIFLLAGFSVSITAQTKSPVSKKKFPIVLNHLKADSVKINEILFRPEKILKNDNLVLIVDEGSDYYFSLYSYPDFKLLKQYGKKGKGPDEIDFPPYVYYFDKEKIDFFDYHRNAIFELQLNEQKNSLKVLQVLSPDLIEIQNAIQLSDTMVSGSGARKGKVFFYNTRTDDIRYYDYDNEVKIPEQHQHIIYSGSIGANFISKKLIFATQYFDNYEAYDFMGNRILSVFNPDEKQVFFKNGYLTNQDAKMYYTAVFATEQYFYLLSYGGRSTKQLMKLLEKESENICEIQKYTWKGKPVESFVIDKPVKSFFVDESQNAIYIINSVSEDFPVVKYRIK